MTGNAPLRCSFCAKDQAAVSKLIAGPDGLLICDDCVGLCVEILTAGDGAAPGPRAHLLADWRGAYIEEAGRAERVHGGPVPGCVFCELFRPGRPDEDTNIVWRGERVVAILNVYPYTSGHLMVMPVRHVADLEALDGAEEAGLWATVRAAVAAVKAAYAPDGLNVGINLGRAAGAGIPGHLHVHVVPRWDGDTNFMTAVGNTRVLPEGLARTRDKLAAAWPTPG